MKRLLHPVRAASLSVMAAALGAVGWYTYRTIAHPLILDAPRPAVAPDSPDTLPPLRASIVDAPITYDLSGALDSLEAALPRSYGDINQRIQAGDNWRAHFAFAVSRTPFRLRMNGRTVSLSTTVEYEARGWYLPPIGPQISAACGTGGVKRPRIVATLSSTAQITPDWGLRTRTRITRLAPATDTPRDKCRITPLRIDITPRVLETVRHLLERGLAQIDSGVARWDSRSRFAELWRTLQRPIRFTDSVYMTMNPYSAQLGTIEARGDTVIAALRLVASPQVLTGPRPQDSALARPMPRLGQKTRAGSGAQVRMEGTLSYPVATALLRKALVGRQFEQAGRRLTIADVETMGIGGGRVALGIDLKGAARGRLWFTGTPQLDRQERELRVPDLDYDIGSSNLLVQGLEWLSGDELRDLLRDRARISEAELLGRLSDMAEQGINRTLTDGIILSGTVHRAEAVSVRASVSDIRVRAIAEGSLRLDIDKAPHVPRPLPAGKARRRN